MRETKEKIEDLETENKRLKERMQKMEELLYPLRAAVVHITRKPSPQFSPNTQSPEIAPKYRKKSYQ
jgi:predicted RNase H-like nuclease (RuvC/YqgF family)